MKNVKCPLRAAALVLLAVSATACFSVRIKEDAGDVEARFRSAAREISRLESLNPDRRGRAHEVRILVYNRDDREIIEVRAAIWLVKAVLSLGLNAAEAEGGLDFEEKYGLAWRRLRDLDQFGPGLLIEVDDEETRVLIWMK